MRQIAITACYSRINAVVRECKFEAEGEEVEGLNSRAETEGAMLGRQAILAPT